MAKKKAVNVADERPIKYAVLNVNGYVIPEEDLILTVQTAREMLRWEDEPTYTARMMSEDPSLLPQQCLYGEEFLLKDLDGHKVRCWNNLGNRDFKPVYKKYAQDILTRRWAGTTGRDGETTNCETIVIGRSERIISGQHRLVGLVIAGQMWESDKKKWAKYWAEEPYIKTLVAFGCDESPLTTCTIDQVLTRSETDVIQTSGIFDDLQLPNKKGEIEVASTYDKREHARMLAAATDLVWERTRAAGNITTGMDADAACAYQTHGASMDFIGRHERLIKCVKHLFTEDMERSISNLGLSAGQCAGLMYLMASSASDGNKYRGTAAQTAVRHERKLDWSREDAARQFFVNLAKKDPSLQPIFDAKRPRVTDTSPDAYTGKVFGEGESTGTRDERMGVLAKAWNLLVAGEKLTVNALRLAYDTPQDSDEYVIDVKLLEHPSVGGADLGPRRNAPKTVKPGVANGDPKPDELKRRVAEENAAKLKTLRESGGSKRAVDEVTDPGVHVFTTVKPKNRRVDPTGPPTDEPIQEEIVEEQVTEEQIEEADADFVNPANGEVEQDMAEANGSLPEEITEEIQVEEEVPSQPVKEQVVEEVVADPDEAVVTPKKGNGKRKVKEATSRGVR